MTATVRRDARHGEDKNSEDRLTAVFSALANATRRNILEQLVDGEANVNEIAAPLNLSLPAVSRHIKVLEQAGLVVRGRRAQFRPCSIDAAPLEAVSTWTEHYRPVWEASFDRMDDYLDRLGSPSRAATKTNPAIEDNQPPE